jgi:hypothetical protein
MLLAVSILVPAASARASEPAVKQLNFRVLARYDYTHINSEEAFRFSPPPPVLTRRAEQTAEVDVDEGLFLGTLTLPIGHSLGARVFAGPTTSKTHIDTFEETKTGGLLIGGDVFLRDPEVGEIGIGPRYFWDESTRGQVDRSNHAAGVEAYASLFLGDFLVGPIDLTTSARFLDADIDSDGAFSAERNYRAAGQATAYVSDRVAVGLGGSWSRTNFGSGDHITFQSADIDIDVLLPTPVPVTLGADVSIGEQDVGSGDFANFGRQFFSIGLSVTVSFVEATSLLELNRFFY